MVLIFFFVPSVPVTGSWRVKLGQIDFIGSGLLICSSVLVLLALSWGGECARAWVG